MGFPPLWMKSCFSQFVYAWLGGNKLLHAWPLCKVLPPLLLFSMVRYSLHVAVTQALSPWRSGAASPAVSPEAKECLQFSGCLLRQHQGSHAAPRPSQSQPILCLTWIQQAVRRTSAVCAKSLCCCCSSSGSQVPLGLQISLLAVERRS